MKFNKFIFAGLLLLSTLHAKEQVNINFSNLEIEEFIRLVGKLTDRNILITQKVSGTVDMVSSAPVYDTELMDILISVLESKGFTMIKNGSIYEIVRSNDAAKSTYKVEQQDSRLGGSLMTTQVITVRGENVDIVAAKIRYLISTGAKLMTMKESNTILLTDYPKNIETVKKVIDQIDTKRENEVKIIPIKHTEIKKLQAKLVDISKSIFNEKIDAEQVKVLLDENTNSIILVGKSSNLTKLEELIAKLDIEALSSSVQIFILKNSDVKSVVASLNEIISKQTFADPALKPNISASEEINGVIAVGDPSVINGIKAIIDELDKEKFQVYVKAKVINVNKKNAESLGIKWGFDGGIVGSDGGLYSLATKIGGTSIPLAPPNTSIFQALDAANTNFALGATLDFLETNGAAQSISNPSILCVNNQESSIYVGKTISIASGQTSVAGSTTASYQREDVGLTLKIKPRVSSNDKVTLNVETVMENITDNGLDADGKPIRQPETSKQEVKTQAILSHGEDIIIGGLVKSYESESISKIPLLGDIPWVGEWLFSSSTVSVEEDNLVVILTPYIVEKSEKLSILQKELGILATLQEEYNKQVFKKIEEKGLETPREEENIQTQEDTVRVIREGE